MTSDFDFVEGLYSESLAKRADLGGLMSLSEPEKHVLLAWWAKGEIDNGGFALLYASPVDIDDVERAFSAVGLLDAAFACRESKAAFGREVPITLEKRVEIIESINDPSQGKDPWHMADRRIWALGDEFDSVVAAYIKAHQSSFSDLP